MSSGTGNGNGGSSCRRRWTHERSSSRHRLYPANDVWPEPIVEAVVELVAIDASRSGGRLAAAFALANVFQVCSSWRAVSHSNMLWHSLTRSVWGHHQLRHRTWREEYIYRHRTARNFRTRRSSHFTLHFEASNVGDRNDPDAMTCRCLVLADDQLACGFADGDVQVFHLPTRMHLHTFSPPHRDRLGRFSRAVSGIVIAGARFVFATLDGDIHVAHTQTRGSNAHPRTAHFGDVVNDGALVDFTGCRQRWVGLFAGVPGRAFHMWDANTEECVFVGGSLTDPEALLGWHMLTELTEPVGQVRITAGDLAVACTSSRLMVFDLRNQGVVMGEREHPGGTIVGTFDVCNESYIIVDGRGVAIVGRLGSSDEVCRFDVWAQRGIMGCINGGYALMAAADIISAWEIEQNGEYLYSFRERIARIRAMAADDRYVAVASSNMTIYLWDFEGTSLAD